MEEYGYRKQATLVNSTIYIYLIICFLLLLAYIDYEFGPKQIASIRDTRTDISLTSNFQVYSIGYFSFFPQKCYLLML